MALQAPLRVDFRLEEAYIHRQKNLIILITTQIKKIIIVGAHLPIGPFAFV